MSKAAKKSVSCAGRQFKVLSQGVLLGDINFRKRSLTVRWAVGRSSSTSMTLCVCVRAVRS